MCAIFPSVSYGKLVFIVFVGTQRVVTFSIIWTKTIIPCEGMFYMTTFDQFMLSPGLHLIYVAGARISSLRLYSWATIFKLLSLLNNWLFWIHEDEEEKNPDAEIGNNK